MKNNKQKIILKLTTVILILAIFGLILYGLYFFSMDSSVSDIQIDDRDIISNSQDKNKQDDNNNTSQTEDSDYNATNKLIIDQDFQLNIEALNDIEVLPLTEVAVDDFCGSGYSIKYPSNWFIYHTWSHVDVDSCINDWKIVSPNKLVAVNFKINWIDMYGYSGMPQPTFVFDNYEAMLNHADILYIEKAYYFNGYGDETGDNLSYYFGIQDIGQKEASIFKYNYNFTIENDGRSPFGIRLNLDISIINDDTSIDKLTRSDFNKFIGTRSYDIAKEIIKSLKSPN